MGVGDAVAENVKESASEADGVRVAPDPERVSVHVWLAARVRLADTEAVRLDSERERVTDGLHVSVRVWEMEGGLTLGVRLLDLVQVVCVRVGVLVPVVLAEGVLGDVENVEVGDQVWDPDGLRESVAVDEPDSVDVGLGDGVGDLLREPVRVSDNVQTSLPLWVEDMELDPVPLLDWEGVHVVVGA